MRALAVNKMDKKGGFPSFLMDISNSRPSRGNPHMRWNNFHGGHNQKRTVVQVETRLRDEDESVSDHMDDMMVERRLGIYDSGKPYFNYS